MEKTFHLVLYRSPGEVFYTLPQMKFFDDAHVDSYVLIPIILSPFRA